MLITFICIASALTIAGVGLAVWPLLSKKHGDSDADRREANLALLRQQFEDLKREYEEGRIPEDEYNETRSEIEMRVIEETASGETAVATGRHGLYAACVVIVLTPVLAFVGYTNLGKPEAMDPEFTLEQERIAQRMRGGHDEAQIQDQIRYLEERVQQNPDNVDVWVMLARTNASFKNWEKSSEAFAQIDRLIPNNPDVLADWADVMAAANGGSLEGRPKELLEKALEVDPGHWKALALLGTLCYDKKDYEGAVKLWEKMREGTEQGSEEWKQITENIEQARRMGGLPPGSGAALIAVDGNKSSSADPKNLPDNLRIITGTVELSEEMKAKTLPDDTVFVFARPVTGGKMPVAFVSLKVKDLPAKFRLDGQSQMGMGTKTLNDVDTVVIEARISRSGNFMPSAGDLEGAVAEQISVPTQGVKVIVNKVRQ